MSKSMRLFSEQIQAIRRRVHTNITAHGEGVEFTASDLTTLDKLHSIHQQLEQSDGVFFVSTIVSHKHKGPLVNVTWNGHGAQMTPDKAREIANMLLDGAAAAEMDSLLVKFLEGPKMGLAAEDAAIVLSNFREARGASKRMPGRGVTL